MEPCLHQAETPSSGVKNVVVTGDFAYGSVVRC